MPAHSTQGAAVTVLEAHSADEWEDVVGRCFYPVHCVSVEACFTGQMRHLPLSGGLSVTSISADGNSIQRSEKQAARSSSDDIHVSMQVASRGTVRQGRRMVSTRPGSITMYATHLPYSQDYSAPGQRQLLVQVSRAALGLSRATIHDALAQLALPSTDASRVFFGHAAALQQRALRSDLEPRASAAEITEDLASTMIRAAAAGRRVVPRTPGGLLCAIEDFVGTNLARVSVDEIATEFFVSRRRLYDLFENLETTPGEFLRRRRLGAAASRLNDPSHAKTTINEIAAETGFEDATTFTRAFRREYGMTPREWRRQLDPLAVPALSTGSLVA